MFFIGLATMPHFEVFRFKNHHWIVSTVHDIKVEFGMKSIALELAQIILPRVAHIVFAIDCIIDDTTNIYIYTCIYAVIQLLRCKVCCAVVFRFVFPHLKRFLKSS